MKIRKEFKRVLSCILTVSLSVLQPAAAIAAELIIDPVRVEGTRFTKDQLIEGDLVYFGVATMNIGEGNGIYEIPIYREGDLSKEAAVTIHSLDISALYKKDYALLGHNKKEYKSEKTILELAMTGESPGELEEITYQFDEYGNLLGEEDRSEIFPDDLTATPSDAQREELQSVFPEEESEVVSAGDGAASVTDDNNPVYGETEVSEENGDSQESELLSDKVMTEGAASVQQGDGETYLPEGNVEASVSDKESGPASEEAGEENEDADTEDTIISGKEENGSGLIDGEGFPDADGSDAVISDESTEALEKTAFPADEENVSGEEDHSLLPDLSPALRKIRKGSMFPTVWTGMLFAPETSTSLATAGNFDREDDTEDIGDPDVPTPVTASEDAEDNTSGFITEETLVVSPAGTEADSYVSTSGTAWAADDEEDLKESELLYAREDLSFADGKSRLAVLKELETGQPTRESLAGGISASLTEAVLSQLVPEYLRKMPHSAEQVITFAPGEDTAYLRFRLYDDGESEGSEAFSFVITDTEGFEPYLATSLSVLISDDEDPVYSRISFDASSYQIHKGTAVITIKREDALYSIATANLTGTDMETGEKHIYGTVAFAPYEEEKEAELYLTRETALALTDFSAAEEGEITEAQAVSSEDTPVRFRKGSPAEVKSAADEELEGGYDCAFDISIDNKKYMVKYNRKDVVAKIYDQGYTPELEVGQYYFSTDRAHDGIFKYNSNYLEGNRPGAWGTAESAYICSGDDYHGAYGSVRYYSTTTTDVGRLITWSHAENKTAVNPLYYQYLIPDWEETSNFGSFFDHPQQVEFSVKQKDGDDVDTKSIYGQFDREMSTNAAVKINGLRRRLYFKISAVDSSKSRTPKSYMKFYGIAAMYKRNLVSAMNPQEMEFKSGNSTVKSLPVQFKVKCGAQVAEPGGQDQKNIFTNPDPEQSNLVFSLEDIKLNNATGKFGHIEGYKITISGSDKDNKVTADYPEDFVSYLNQMSKDGVSTDMIDYSQDAVTSEIKKINNALDTVPVDVYFTDWIEHTAKKVYSSGVGGASYYQELWFTPKFAYNDITVMVTGPDKAKNTCGATFNDKLLQVKEGTEVKFHAGDMLDLSATVTDPAGFRVTGFEISTDGGAHFDSIREEQFYTLTTPKNGNKYIVRPLVEANDNHVEVQFASDLAKQNLQIENLIPAKDLESDPLWKGRNIIDFNPKAATLSERMRPAVGSVSTLNVLITGKPSDSGYIYRPVIKDRMTGKSYNTQGYSFELRSNAGDNVIIVDIEKIKASDLKTFSLDGQVMSTLPSIREDGLGAHSNPAAGYTVYTVNGQGEYKDESGKAFTHVSEVSAVVGADGSIAIEGITAKEGDRITLLTDNGFNDAQVTEYVFGKPDTSGKVHIGKIDLHYPAHAPSIRSLIYDYDLDSSRQKADLSSNSVRCFDDNLTLTATVDFAGRQVEKLVYTVTTVTGTKSKYEAKPVAEGANVYTTKINGMLDNLHNGDRISVYIVDKEKRKISLDKGKSTVTVDIVYPTVETGLVAYVENELIKPKDLTLDGDVGNIDIPLIGTGHSRAQSGTMTFSRTDWPDKQGYSMMINFDMLLLERNPSPSLDEKKEAASRYLDLAKRTGEAKKMARDTKKRATDAGARASQIRDMVDSDDPREQYNRAMELNKLDREEEFNNSLSKNYTSMAKDSQAQLAKDARISLSTIVVIDLEFVLDPKTQQYVLATTAVTVGGLFNVSKTWYTVISYVPCFLNLAFDAELDVVLGGVCPEGKEAMSAGDFDGYAGNIKDVLGGSTFLWQVDAVLKGTARVGAGICGVLDASGAVTATFQTEFLDDNVAQDFWGIMLGLSGSIIIDLVVTTLKFDVGGISKGWGVFEGQSNISFLQNQWSLDGTQDLESLAEAAALSDIYDMGSEDRISVREYEYGDSDMSAFGQGGSPGGLQGQPLPVHAEILLENASDRTRPKLITLSDGRQFGVFVGASADGDPSCLYYTIRDKDGSWSTPKAVADDNTYDSMPDIKEKDGKIFIAWTDAGNRLEGIEEIKEQLNSFMISGAVYDMASDTMGEEFTLSRNSDAGFCNLAPEISVTDDGFICAYMTRDISKCSTEEKLADMQGNYSTMQLAHYEAASGTVVHEYVMIRHETLKDPLVTDYQTETLKIHDTEYLLTAYTLDLDEDPATDDRDLYLEVHDLTNNVDYWPITVRSDDRSQAVPELTTLNGSTYLTWIEDGNSFELLNVGELVDGLFFDATAGPVYRDYTEGDTEWYIRSAGELGLAQEDFEYTMYGSIANGDFRPFETAIRSGENQASSIDDYVLAADDRDLYLFYTDLGSDVTKPAVELYGKRFRQMGTNAFLDKSGSTPDIDDAWTISESVAITKLDKVIDNFALTMTKDHRISMLSDYYEQYFDDDGELQFSGNSLLGIDFEPVSSVEIVEATLDTGDATIAGKNSVISFDIRNNGLLELEGYRVEAVLSGSGETVYEAEFPDARLDTNETSKVYVHWMVPANVSENGKLNIRVMELGAAASRKDDAEVEISLRPRLSISPEEGVIEDGKIIVRSELMNKGAATLEACSFNAYLYKGHEEGKFLGSAGVPALGSGDRHMAEIIIDPSVDDWDGFGTYWIKLIAVGVDGQELASSYEDIYSLKPVMLDISKGLTTLELKVGDTETLTTVGAPWNDLLTEIRYYSSDNSVATADANGKITAVGKGTCTIYAYSPAYGIIDSVTVTVKENGEKKKRYGGSEGSGHIYGLPSWVTFGGNWLRLENGVWNYELSGDLVRDRWICLYNPYADPKKGQKLYGWFRFNEAGTMLTGWVSDPDGNLYYLNPVSDGTQGMMLTGWQQIDGKWYYFSEAEGSGTMGALFRDTVTPDGYTVNGAGVWVQEEIPAS